MKKFYLTITLIIALTAILSIIIILKNKQNNLVVDEDKTEYCYNTKMGMKLYNGIPNKYCICDGKEINIQPCPKGVMCDSSIIHCKGKIIGFKFGYGWGNNEQGFTDLIEWEKFCNTLAEEKKEGCITNLNYTKSKLNGLGS